MTEKQTTEGDKTLRVDDVWETDRLRVYVLKVVPPECVHERIVLLAFTDETPWPVATTTICPAFAKLIYSEPGSDLERIDVIRDWRRHGIATELWLLAEQRLARTLTGDSISKGGERLIKRVERSRLGQQSIGPQVPR